MSGDGGPRATTVVELALAVSVWIVALKTTALVGISVLFFIFGAFVLFQISAGRAGQSCGCGTGGVVGYGLAGRSAILATIAGAAALPSLTGEFLTLGGMVSFGLWFSLEGLRAARRARQASRSITVNVEA